MKERACLLYVDGSEESRLATVVLDERNILYKSIDLRDFLSSDVHAPRLVSHEGRFEGLEEIREYASLFGRRVLSSSS